MALLIELFSINTFKSFAIYGFGFNMQIRKIGFEGKFVNHNRRDTILVSPACVSVWAWPETQVLRLYIKKTIKQTMKLTTILLLFLFLAGVSFAQT
ncbi:MAG: hypothetical protein V4577_01235, partial [Bacteroidota bacterium]